MYTSCCVCTNVALIFWDKAFLHSTFDVIICLQIFKDPVSNERGKTLRKAFSRVIGREFLGFEGSSLL